MMESPPVPADDDQALAELSSWARGPLMLPMLRAAGQLNHICEHREHAEPSPYSVTAVSLNLRQTAAAGAARTDWALAGVYADRIRAIETASLYRFIGLDQVNLAGADLLARATTWRQLQLGQLAHDRQFHPDVWGLSRENRLRHYAFHLAKLPWRLAEAIEHNRATGEFWRPWLADVAIFGVVLATADGLKLADEPVDSPGPPGT